MLYYFQVKDDDGVVVFATNKPTLGMLEEEIGRWERHFENSGKTTGTNLSDDIKLD